MKDLDLAALDCLSALADEGSFERAAQRLNITQSAVSQRLRTVEAQTGQLLVVRSRPLRLTEPGKVLLRFARQLHAMRADVARELGVRLEPGEKLPIAVNADSLATWVLPALNEFVQAGLRDGWGLELVVDDQDFTHDWLRQGAVLGCVSTVRQALRGCVAQPLGVMRYVAVVSPEFAHRALPKGLSPANFSQIPFLVFNRKDDTQALWAAKAFGLRSPRLQERYVPSSEAIVQAVLMGWGVGVVPEIQVRALTDQGALQILRPDVMVDMALYWHQWKLVPEAEMPASRVALLNQLGTALAQGAKLAFAA